MARATVTLPWNETPICTARRQQGSLGAHCLDRAAGRTRTDCLPLTRRVHCQLCFCGIESVEQESPCGAAAAFHLMKHACSTLGSGYRNRTCLNGVRTHSPPRGARMALLDPALGIEPSRTGFKGPAAPSVVAGIRKSGAALPLSYQAPRSAAPSADGDLKQLRMPGRDSNPRPTPNCDSRRAFLADREERPPCCAQALPLVGARCGGRTRAASLED